MLCSIVSVIVVFDISYISNWFLLCPTNVSFLNFNTFVYGLLDLFALRFMV